MRRLAAFTVFGFLGFFLTLASLPAAVAAAGTSEGVAGLVTTVFLAGTIGTQTIVPRLTERFGLRPVLVAGCLLLGAPAPLLAVSADLRLVLLVSVVRGCGFGILTVLGASLSALIVPANRRGEAIGIYGLAIAVPNLFAVPLGVALASSGHFGWVAWLAAAPLAGVPVAVALARSVPELPAAARNDGGTRAAAAATVAPAVVLLVVTLAGGALLTYLPITLPTGSTATVAVLVFGATGAISRWLVGGLSDRIGPKLLLPVSSLIAVVGLVVAAAGLAGDGTAVAVVLGGAVLGVGYGSVQNLTLVTAFNRAGSAHTHTASAVWNMGFDGGTALGAAAVGAGAALIGTAPTFLAFAALVALALPLAVVATRPRRR